MNNEIGHSEEYFTEDRNYWFNTDFLDLMAKRWKLNEYSSILDVGSGMCHWSKLLVPYLKPNAQLTALDNDEKWAKGSAEIKRFFDKYNTKIDFVKGDAQKLPFKDNSFDVVTCQTVLIHVKNPTLALKEMKRVVRKGGIVICSEPNNRIQALLQDTSNQDDNINVILQRVKQNLAIEKYKLQQNQGNSSFGDLVTGTMSTLGYKNIQSFLNDKLISIYPPYETNEQRAKINTFLTWGKSELELKSFEKDYKSAIENNEYSSFLKNQKTFTSENKVANDIKSQSYANGGASLLYLISGEK
jgi:ubiquinone/menaquinone biosynthesis C-methylase UbiE